MKTRAETFRALHEGKGILVLPNAWDAASAKVFEMEGYKAIGTTSAGISATLGLPDGQRITLEDNASFVRRISKRTELPVNADLEAGYARTSSGVAASAQAIMEAGAVGINLEDSDNGLLDMREMAERIMAVKEAAPQLFLNARIDTYLSHHGGIGATLDRATLYVEAGADCIFVPTPLDRPGILSKEDIKTLVKDIPVPVNLLAGAVTFSVKELKGLGVKRVSLGPGPMRACLAFLRKISRELNNQGTYNNIMKNTIPYAEVNSWFQSY